MEKLTKILIIFTIGVAALAISRFFYFYPNLFLPLWFIVMGYLIYKELLKHKETNFFHPAIIEHGVPWIIIIGIAFLFQGHGINFGTNIVSYLLEGGSVTLFHTVYFLDEILSHAIMFVGIYTLFFAATILQTERPFSKKMHRDDELALGVCGILFGLGMGGSLLEGNVGLPGLIMSAIFLPGLLLRHIKHKLKVVVRKYPLNYFFVMCFGTIIVFFLIYLIVVGDFRSPTQLICEMGFEKACLAYTGLR